MASVLAQRAVAGKANVSDFGELSRDAFAGERG
jgi:hypothetical protein